MENYNLPLNFQLNNKYRIKKVLGQGGFGITYLAEDTLLDIEVCVKELFISGSSTRGSNMTVMTHNMKDFSFADFKERFIQEAKQLAKFKHPNIVRVQDFFEANNTAYVVMEYIEGQTLKDKVAYGGPLSADASQKIIESILDAVEVVHKAGMLHRDIKPDNLIIGNDGRVVLIDFGSARAYSDEKTIAQTAMVSPGYAPLEQYNPTDRKGTFTDIYSIGATFYFMLTGEKPLNVTNRYSERLKAPHEINPNVSMQVSSAVMLAMEMKAEDRFQSVGDFRLALQQMKGSKNDGSKEETKVVSKPNVDKKTFENKNNILPKVIIGIALILLVTVVVIFYVPSSKSEICDCADTMLAMMKEAKGNLKDRDKMEAIKNKYEAKIEKCEKMSEGKSEEDQKKMKEEMENCPAAKEAEILMKEMIGGAEQ